MKRFCCAAMTLLALLGAVVAQEREPQSARAYVDRGIARYNKGDLDGAIADHTKAIALDPNYANAYGNRGYAREDRGDLDGALADYTKAIALDPKGAEAYGLRGSARLKKRDMDGALADFTKAITLNPNDASAHGTRGIIRQMKGDLNGALDDFKKAITLDAKYVPGYKALAFLLSTTSKPELRDGKLAVGYARKACELEKWQDPFCLDILASAYAEAGDFQQAVEWQQKALEFPDYVQKAGDSARRRLDLYRKRQPYRGK